MGLYRSLIVFTDPNKSLWVLRGGLLSLWILMVLMGRYRSLFVFMDFNGSLWVLMGLCWSLLVVMYSY